MPSLTISKPDFKEGLKEYKNATAVEGNREVTQRREDVALDFCFRLSCPARYYAERTTTRLPGKKRSSINWPFLSVDSLQPQSVVVRKPRAKGNKKLLSWAN